MSEESMIPKDFSTAVKDIKLAILQARARAARVSNVEALKLYFYVGGYISKKTRSAKWGSGAIDVLSERLQVELPGLRGFSSSSMKFMRLWYEAWSEWFAIRYLASNELEQTSSTDDGGGFVLEPIRYLASNEFNRDAIGSGVGEKRRSCRFDSGGQARAKESHSTGEKRHSCRFDRGNRGC